MAEPWKTDKWFTSQWTYLPELTNMCDRILVMRDGRTVGELSRDEFDEERIMVLASGVEKEAA